MSQSQAPIPSANPWKEAAASLSKEDQATLDFEHREKLVVLEDLHRITANEIRRCERERICFTRKSGEKVIARDLFAKIVKWIHHFKQLGDVAVQYDPGHAALPWAGVRFLLEIAVSDVKATELILEHTTSVAELISRYAVFEELFLRSPSSAATELRVALAGLYTKVLLYMAQAKSYFQTSTFKRSVKNALLATPDFEGNFAEIISSQGTVDRCAAMVNAQEQLERHSELKTILADINTPINRVDKLVKGIKDELDESTRIQILQWLSREPYQKHHKQARSNFLPGTGSWLLKSSIYRKWKNDSASSVLWLHGIPGSGKSKLASLVIEDHLENSKNGQCPPPVYFYCSRNPAEPGRSNPTQILASTARQLAHAGQSSQLLPPVTARHQKEKSEGFSGGSLELDECRDLILELLPLHPMVTIVVDALDECDSETRTDLLLALDGILLQSSTLIKVFVTSRNDQDIVYHLGTYPNLELSSEHNSDDIHEFVKAETHKLISRRALLRFSKNQRAMSESIIETISQGANGMFLWASLQLQALCHVKTDQAINERVGKLPSKLEDLYQEIIAKVERNPSETDRKYTFNIFHWLLSARRRLTTEEFLAAVAIFVGSSAAQLTKEEVLDLSWNLVVYDSALDTFRFAHLSVREFLEKQPMLTTELSHATVSEACLLSLIAFADTEETSQFLRQCENTTPNMNAIHAVYEYAALYWGMHCHNSGCCRLSGNIELLMGYLLAGETKKASPFTLWEYELTKIYQRDTPHGGNSSLADKTSALFTACVFDLVEVIEKRLQDDLNLAPPVKGRYRHELLREAMLHDSWNTVALLMDSDLGEDKTQLLRFAVKCCSSGMVAQCLSHFGSQVTIGEETILAASVSGKAADRIVRLLLESTTDRVIISEGMLECFAFQPAVMMILRDYNPAQFHSQVSERVLEKAAEYSTAEFVEILVSKQNAHLITEAVVDAAASNTRYGYAVMKVLLQASEGHFPITEEIVLTACDNKDQRGGLLELIRGLKSSPLTQDFIDVALVHGEYGAKAVRLFRNKKSERLIITEKTLTAGVECGLEIMKILLDHPGNETLIPEAALRSAVCDRDCGFDIMNLIFNTSGVHVDITESLLLDAAISGDSDLFKLLLGQRAGKPTLPEDVLLAAAGNRLHGAEIMQFILSHKAHDIQITEHVWIAAAYKRNRLVLQYLLCIPESAAAITADVIVVAAQRLKERNLVRDLLVAGPSIEYANRMLEAAAANEWAGSDIVQLLMEHFGPLVCITDTAIEAACRTIIDNRERISFLIEHYKQEGPFSEPVLKAAAARSYYSTAVLSLLEERQKSKLQITGDLLVAAAVTYRTFELLLARCDGDVAITRAILQSAIERWDDSDLDYFLSKDGLQVELTEELLEYAARFGCKQTIDVLLHHLPDCTEIKHSTVLAAARNWIDCDVLGQLLEIRPDCLTSDVVAAAAGGKYAGTCTDIKVSHLAGVYPQEAKAAITENVMRTVALAGGTTVFEIFQKQLSIIPSAEHRLIAEFFAAARYGHYDTIRRCLDEGIHPDIQDNEGRTLLSIVAENINFSFGGDEEPRFLEYDHYRVLKWLLEARVVDVNLADNYGQTPLHYAAAHDLFDLSRGVKHIRLLLKAGARPDIKDEDGKTPLDLAEEERNYIIRNVLREASTSA